MSLLVVAGTSSTLPRDLHPSTSLDLVSSSCSTGSSMTEAASSSSETSLQKDPSTAAAASNNIDCTTTAIPRMPRSTSNGDGSSSSSSNNTTIPLQSRSVQTPGLAPTRLLTPNPYAAARVLKGEIHNVLTVMRAEDYVSPHRFVEEVIVSVNHANDSSSISNSMMHPIASQLEHVHALLSSQTTGLDLAQLPLYLKPFLNAVKHREIRAAVTGACLGALHKFVLYGFIDLTQHKLAAPLLTMMAEALLECRFEEQGGTERKSAAGVARDMIAQSAAIRSHHNHNHTNKSLCALTPAQEEEHVVLKLLGLSALIVRCSLQDQALLSSHILVGLLETCLHVSHKAKRASPLLKSAAADALSQMVLQVFAGTGAPILQARHEILAKLVGLLNPSSSSSSSNSKSTTTTSATVHHQYSTDPQVTHTALTLLNIALETCREPLTDADIGILQNDLCKYLLLTSTTHDTYILTLTLRVIFNLFQTIRNHLKVPLEVFLTSVHLRIMESPTCAADEKEIAIESLLEFCQEPELMQDIYLNYDCDVACTNLFEAIVQSLGKVALPGGWNPLLLDDGMSERTDDNGEGLTQQMNGNKSVDHAGSKDGASNSTLATTASTVASASGKDSAAAASTSHSPPVHQVVPAPLTILNRLALDGLLAVLDSIAKRCSIGGKNARMQPLRSADSIMSSSASVTSGIDSDDGMDDEDDDDDEEANDGLDNNISIGHLEYAPGQRPLPDEELRERKLKKMALSKVARAFNFNSTSGDWLELAVQQEIVDGADNAKEVAEFFYSAPGIDKVKLGIYLSKGPEKDWPFEACVRTSFVALYDFKGLNFAAALRKFLSKFRLPGEAQCIDRLMEAFSKEYYSQEQSIFANADAVYVVSFSTIMLNTDLHNPSIAEDKRMTLQQFIKNNRGINDGSDMPEDFLINLYGDIKEKPIQVRKEMDEVMKRRENVDFKTAWESILAKSTEVADPFFGPAGERAPSEAGVHDKEMFIVLSSWLLKDLTGMFLRSWDDALVVKAVAGIKEMAKIAAYFELDKVVNDILLTLLPMGRDYVMGCVALDYVSSAENDNASVASGQRTINSIDGAETDDDTAFDSEMPIPYGLLCSASHGRCGANIYGSAAHRGLLALDCSFVLLRTYGTMVTTAWPGFVECLCALRDARALPLGLADLDDFADSNGNVLPLSPFARSSHKRLEEYYKSQADPEAPKKNQKGWFGTFFRKQANEKDGDSVDDGSVQRREMSTYTKALLGVAEAADVENVIQMGSTKLPVAEHTIEALLEAVGHYPYKDDPVLEQHAIFSLELAARALLSNRKRATKLFPLFLSTFETVLTGVDEANPRAPFVVERVAVTVLRCCIHLYDLAELRPHLRSSLHLLTMALPRSFIKAIADRMACGLAIILRASFHFFESANEWAFVGDTLDVLAHYSNARVFVFDGIASTVEYAIPAGISESNGSVDKDRPLLSKLACTAVARILIRFVLGFYQNDLALAIPALLCLEKVYRYNNELLLQDDATKGESTASLDHVDVVLDTDLWQNVAVAMYSACRSTDYDLSRRGVDCYQRLILQTSVDQIPDEKWIAILYLMVNKQPPLVAEDSRINTFSVLGKLLCKVLPVLSHRAENREDLYDLVSTVAALAQENLRHGRKGAITPLFEQTLQTVTYMSNHMTTEEWNGEQEFSAWASETLLAELEKVGAAGASATNKAAVMPLKQERAGEVTAESS